MLNLVFRIRGSQRIECIYSDFTHSREQLYYLFSVQENPK